MTARPKNIIEDLFDKSFFSFISMRNFACRSMNFYISFWKKTILRWHKWIPTVCTLDSVWTNWMTALRKRNDGCFLKLVIIGFQRNDATAVPHFYVQTKMTKPWVGIDDCSKCYEYNQRTPGLFKLEWSGDGITALCSKTYCCFNNTSLPRDNLTAKGVQKFGNPLQKQDFCNVLYL